MATTPNPTQLTLLASPRAARSPSARTRPGRARPSRYAAFRLPPPALATTLARASRWLSACATMAIAIGWDALLGRDTPARRAARARRLVESMDPLAIRTAQQISMRLDVLPLEYAAELSRLSDAAPPMHFPYAVSRIQKATGGRLVEVFEAVDPKPIQSDAVSCVYQAVLRDGTKVAVRVRRPDALRAIGAEASALHLLLGLLAWAGDGRGGILRRLRGELGPLLVEPLDFTRVARVQRIFRRDAKKQRLRYLSAAKVFARLSSEDVIVSEFVSGVWLSEVVDAEETQDEAALAKLREMGIEPARCGRRLLHVCWWGFFESMFFSGTPRASQIVVEPGGRLTFVSLGTTGSLNQRHRRLLGTALERIAAYDVEGAVELVLQLLMPMPPIDLYAFAKSIERRIWEGLFSLENPGRPWWERTGTALWLAILRSAREHGVPVRIELSRMMQSACLYDHLAARLWPGLRLLREFRRYRDQQHRREARVVARHMEKRVGHDLGALVPEAHKVVEQVRLQLETLIDTPPLRYASVIRKASYATWQTLVMLLTWAKVAAALVALRFGAVWFRSGRADLAGAARWVASNPVFYGAGMLLIVLTARRILFRLGDVDRSRA